MLFTTHTKISNHGVRKSWIYWTLCLLSYLELHGTFPWMFLHYFLQMREEISEKFEQLVKSVDFMEYSGYFQEIYPSQGTQAMLTWRQGKFELFNPSHAKGAVKLEEQHRQGAAVQPYPVIT